MFSYSYKGIDLLRPPKKTGAQYTGRHSASFMVTGYFGRVPDGEILFEGKSYKVPENPLEEDPINKALRLHGFGPTAVWNVKEITSDKVTFVTPDNFLPEGYPFPYSAEISYILDDDNFILNSSITALKKGRYSLTWHPYFRRVLGSGSAHVKAKFNSTHVFPSAMIPLPFSAPIKTPSHWSYSSKFKEILAPSDSSFLGWNGAKGIEIVWNDIKDSENLGKDSLTLKMLANTNVLHIYTDLADYVCVEPSTSPANGFWLAEKGFISDEFNGRVLNEGESLELIIEHKI